MQTKNNSDDETIEADNKSHTETSGEKNEILSVQRLI